jgi:hypothetical protein
MSHELAPAKGLVTDRYVMFKLTAIYMCVGGHVGKCACVNEPWA